MNLRNSIFLWLILRVGFPVLLVSVGSSVSAQVDCIGQPIVHLVHLRGRVFDAIGAVIPSIRLKLTQNDRVVAETTSDENGHFDFKAQPGRYELQVQSQYFRAIPLTVHVGTDLRGILHPGELRWVLEITGLNCSWATTSVAEFEKEIRLNNERLKRDTAKYATQK
jgi:hypothetical protein